MCLDFLAPLLSPLSQYKAASLAGVSSFVLLRHFNLNSNLKPTAASAIPFSACYLGVYFANRDQNDAASQVAWAVLACSGGATLALACSACAHALFHSKTQLRVSEWKYSVARMPLAVGCLLAYDQLHAVRQNRHGEDAVKWSWDAIAKDLEEREAVVGICVV
ncbi:hypothetical protein BCR33DRAFT_718847 [Rhizoclosmatium globosum]|uniref:Uncharacterized protein n=1 Tax=Rhizoclosmatium globosum TaxID=329046 RepID=A0A1Y2C451_9FUNG|nr:hypothetical protein BCR33DRAFT_718847 [Rhizoclosmatium globosum]|eukprot:ORY41726.1 hypothetical protein BCR33DRAFT_718847 [Rhizoclosmatium globosum]